MEMTSFAQVAQHAVTRAKKVGEEEYDPKDKDDAKKSILGDKQKKWLKEELLAKVRAIA